MADASFHPMSLEQILLEKREMIQGRWLSAVLETYPEDARRFFRKQKDQFANPVGHTFSKELGRLLVGLLERRNSEDLVPVLDRIIRVRAIQDFSPSQSLAFLFALKPIIRETAEKEIREEALAGELEALEAHIDEVVLWAVDVYVGCREKLYEMRANQFKNQVSGLLRRAGLISEVPSWDSRSTDQERNHPMNST